MLKAQPVEGPVGTSFDIFCLEWITDRPSATSSSGTYSDPERALGQRAMSDSTNSRRARLPDLL